MQIEAPQIESMLKASPVLNLNIQQPELSPVSMESICDSVLRQRAEETWRVAQRLASLLDLWTKFITFAAQGWRISEGVQVSITSSFPNLAFYREALEYFADPHAACYCPANTPVCQLGEFLTAIRTEAESLLRALYALGPKSAFFKQPVKDTLAEMGRYFVVPPTSAQDRPQKRSVFTRQPIASLSPTGHNFDFNAALAARAQEQPRLVVALAQLIQQLRTSPLASLGIGSPLRPRWDSQARTLYLGEQLVKRFARGAKNQFLVLDGFEAEHWPLVIESPLANFLTNQTLSDLNKNTREWIVFHSNGSGGITWSPLEKS